MRIVEITGGLGNQMFQYAFYLEMKSINSDISIGLSSFRDYKLHNGFELKNIFNIDPSIASIDDIEYLIGKNCSIKRFYQKFLKVNSKNMIIQKEFNFDSKYLLNINEAYYSGYWQSEKYFEPMKDKVRSVFIFKKLYGINLAFYEKIKKQNTISVHIRRGDYINNSLYEGVCNLDYYKEAMDVISRNTANPVFIMFSDDMVWCKSNFKNENIIHVDWNTGLDSYMDMHLMSLCHHNIIANSSFSWWGAWLNKSLDKIVVAPKKWFNDININTDDICPESWLRI